jgi:hypothetical protein
MFPVSAGTFKDNQVIRFQFHNDLTKRSIGKSLNMSRLRAGRIEDIDPIYDDDIRISLISPLLTNLDLMTSKTLL